MEPLWSLTPLRRRRLNVGWPQWHLARQAGVSVNKVSFAERGLDVLTPADRRRLADALGVEVGELFPEVALQ
jgi:transcriptional regulator with XRE-family HTH domain